MKKYWFLFLACVLSGAAFAQEAFLLPDYEGIQNMGQAEYYALLNRFQAQDTTLSIVDLQTIYYGSAFYGNPSSGLANRRLNAITDTKGNEDAILYVDSVLATSPLNLGTLLTRFTLAYHAHDTITTSAYFWQYNRLVDAIYATGDARSEETALHVVCVDDEYTIMYYVMEVQPEGQMLTSSLCDKIDIVTKNGTKLPVYFDVQLILALRNRMFSSDKKPFHFTYKKIEP